jgi:hypothetical protein
MSASFASVSPHRTRRSCSIHPRIRAPEATHDFIASANFARELVRSEETAVSRFVRSSIAGSDRRLRSWMESCSVFRFNPLERAALQRDA